MLRKCVLQVPTGKICCDTWFFLSPRALRKITSCGSVLARKRPHTYSLVKCQGKPKMGMIGFKIVTLKSQSNG